MLLERGLDLALSYCDPGACLPGSDELLLSGDDDDDRGTTGMGDDAPECGVREVLIGGVTAAATAAAVQQSPTPHSNGDTSNCSTCQPHSRSGRPSARINHPGSRLPFAHAWHHRCSLYPSPRRAPRWLGHAQACLAC